MAQFDDFVAAKCAIFCDGELIVLLRDDIETIPWPGYWDFPGGGREGFESPFKCVQRETFEELGVLITLQDVHFSMAYQSPTQQHRQSWFFAAQIDAVRRDQIVFGDEGQGWVQMPLETFIEHPKAIPFLVKLLKRYLAVSA